VLFDAAQSLRCILSEVRRIWWNHLSMMPDFGNLV
jgi:hypothetical protein